MNDILTIMIVQKKNNSKRNIVIIIITLIVLAGAAIGAYFYMQRTKVVNSYDECVAAGHQILTSYPEQCIGPDGRWFTNPKAAVTIEGVAVCLPHKDTEGPNTLECAVGVKADDGTYYGISGDTSHQLAGEAGSNRRVKILGNIEPSTDTPYKITQLIAVSKIELL